MPDLATMRASVFTEADLRAGQVDDDEVDRLLNEELAGLYELICDAQGNHFAKAVAVSILAGVDEAPLPSDFWRPVDDEALEDTARRATLKSIDFRDRFAPPHLGYCIHGTKILVRPSAQAPGSYRLHYIPVWRDLEDDGDEFNPPNGWHMYAVLGVAIRLRNQQELSASGLEDRRKTVAGRIEAAAKRRKGRHKVRDTRGARLRASDVDLA